MKFFTNKGLNIMNKIKQLRNIWPRNKTKFSGTQSLM